MRRSYVLRHFIQITFNRYVPSTEHPSVQIQIRTELLRKKMDVHPKCMSILYSTVKVLFIPYLFTDHANPPFQKFRAVISSEMDNVKNLIYVD